MRHIGTKFVGAVYSRPSQLNITLVRQRNDGAPFWTPRLIVLLVCAMASGADARVWLVKPDGSGDTTTIQAAIDLAQAGDDIVVAAGLYNENLDTHNKSLHLQGAGANVTIVDGGRRARVLLLGRGGVVEGFTFRRGQASGTGGGVSIGGPAAVVVRNNIIEDNFVGAFDSGLGGGIYFSADAGGALIEGNIIRNNVAGDEGGGIYDRGGGTTHFIRGNIILGNACHVTGGGLSVVEADVENNLIVRNRSDHFGGGVEAKGRARIRWNTIYGNLVGNFFVNGAGVDACGASVVIANNIIAANRQDGNAGSGAGIFCCSSVLAITCNDIWGNDIDLAFDCSAPGSGNFSLDPQFCTADPMTSLNFSLQGDSPCALGNDPLGGTCGLIGAAPVECGTVSVQRQTWGEVKRLFR